MVLMTTAIGMEYEIQNQRGHQTEVGLHILLFVYSCVSHMYTLAPV